MSVKRKQTSTKTKLDKFHATKTMDSSRLKSHLLSSGRLTEEEILRVEDYALTQKISMEESLLFLNLLDYTDLGQNLADIYEIFYHPLLIEAPPDPAKAMVPLKFAERWKIFPVTYNPDKNVLTLAVANSEDRETLGQLQSAFPPSLTLAFTIASVSEIDKAIDVHYKNRPYAQAPELEVPSDFAILIADQEARDRLTLEEVTRTRKKILLLEPDLARASALKTILREEGYLEVSWILSSEEIAKALKEESSELLLVNSRAFQPQGSWLMNIQKEVKLPQISYYHLTPLLLGQEYPYHQMSEALIGLVAFLVRKSLENDQDQLQETLTRVRYCKLLALRLELAPGQVDAAVLAAWLSSEGLGKELLGAITTPYNLEKIIDATTNSDNEDRAEAAVLRIVKKYQTLRKEESQTSTDMHQIRSVLSRRFSSPKTEIILEVFLHLIKDEDFLSRVDQLAGLILVVDPGESYESRMTLRLSNDGYEVVVVPDARTAVDTISASKVDLVISEVNLPGTDGMRLCRAIRENPATVHTPFFFITAEEGKRLPARCLKVGADDFLRKPVELDVLSLKIQRVLAAKTPKTANRGVNGSLSEMNSMDFIQSLSEGQKGVEITLESGGEKGNIYMQNGEIIHACKGTIDGEEALYRLMMWQDGEFQIVPCSDFPPRTIHSSTMSLLMEAARLSDEAEGSIDEEP